MMTSYGGNFEDVLLSRIFKDVPTGLYVDIGACHARDGNCSWVFYERGWRGINIEPGPLFSSLLELRPEDINLQVAVSDHVGEAYFYFHPESPATSTLQPEVAPELGGVVHTRQATVVDILTVETLRDRYLTNRQVQFLKVDVEGHEEAVFAGCDWLRFRPQVIVAEAVRPFTNEPIHQAWSSKLVAAGYVLTLFDGINIWLVREEDPELVERATLPVNQLDYFRPYDREKENMAAELSRLREMPAPGADPRVRGYDSPLKSAGHAVRRTLARLVG